LEGPKNLFDAD
jgi:hypothetical protein